MKNRFKKIILLWIVLGFIVQMSVCVYVDKFYANKKLAIKAEKIDIPEQKKEELLGEVPVNAEDVKVSYDNQYISYKDNGILKLLNVDSKKDKIVNPNTGYKIIFYQWFEENKNLFLIEENENAESLGKKYIVSWYNADNENKPSFPIRFEQIYDNNSSQTSSKNTTKKKKIVVENQTREVPDTNSNSQYRTSEAKSNEKKSIVFNEAKISQLNELLYIKATIDKTTTKVFTINIDGNVSLRKLNSDKIGDISPLNNNQKLVFENANNGTLNINDPKSGNVTLNIPHIEKAKLLLVDNLDNVYLGEKTNGKINKIFTKSLEKKEDFKEIQLPKPSLEKNILMTLDGKVYLNDEENETLVNLTSNSSHKYSGKLLQLSENGFIVLKDNKITLFRF